MRKSGRKKKEDDKNCKMPKNEKLKRAKEQKDATLTRIRQQKITETWNKLPKSERRCLQN